jgi:YidC/Oxa1 family membrane protein insertase
MFQLIANLLAFFYHLWPSYGMAIVFLTLTIMIALTPLTLKGTRSMMVMQSLQPEMKKIQARYKDDRQKLNEELLQFYKDNKINPVSGCLPLLIQMPVFLVLYRVLRGLTNPKLFGVLLDPFTNGRVVPGFNPAYIGHNTDLYKALSSTGQMMSFGMDLSRSATQVVRDSWVSAIPYLILIAGVVITSFYQQKQVQGRNPNAAAVNPQQQMLLKIMPLFFAFISLNLPAALVLYFFVSNLYRVAQQAFISHKIYKPAMAAGMFEAKAKEVPADGDGKAVTSGGAKTGPSKSTPRSTPAKSTPAKSGAKPNSEPAEPEVVTETARSGGFFGRLLGDSAPRLGAGGAAARNGGSPKATTKPAPKPATKPAPARPTTPSRVTPAGSGPQPRARKKKKRK